MGFRVNSAGKVDQSHFARVPPVKMPPRSTFDRSFPHKTTVNEGYLYPIVWLPLLPNDTVNLTVNALIRLLTPIFPYMDNLYADFHAFFVPNRLVWDKWERFQGAQPNPGDTTEFEVPSLDDALMLLVLRLCLSMIISAFLLRLRTFRRPICRSLCRSAPII